MEAVAAEDLTGKARLRRAALHLFARDGFDAVTIRAVAAEADVSYALVRHHFGSKEGLRKAVDEHVLRSLGEAMDELDRDRPLDDLVAARGTVSARLFGADPDMRGYLRRVLLEGGEAGRAVFARLLRGTRAELEGLNAVREDADAEWAPHQVLFLILGPLLLEPVAGPGLFDTETLARRSAANQRLLLDGLFAR
ncbi:TetR/AcrR family transcriptional regulator [Actinomadura darangshiensis]|uniref:TetR/AcrR family transcriptional regulator n=1 Tax=Actinomadura darangshiensis TaxID=705336 RepID=A0A4R5ABW2_9ACTN|nr:TetR/AcrR family transcriptional regulator [Actinomadura darangshiensis]TDD69185.1 TetR/AcrR family transcriptional regulator [Actinomadura darangshiensis]